MNDTSMNDPYVAREAGAPPAAERVDFGRTAADYARHRSGFPPRVYDELATRGIGLPGQRVLDVGTGTGTMARALAARGCAVTGLDISEPLLAQAAQLAGADGLTIAWRRASAEDTGLPDGAADIVTAAQCWHWFDRPRAAAEVRRVLVPGGRVVLAHLDWLALPGNVVEETLAIVDAHRQAPWPVSADLCSHGMYPLWTVDLAAAGFGELEVFGFDVALRYSHEAWRGRMRASAGVGATMDAPRVARFDAALGEALADRYPDPIDVPHRVFVLVGTAPRRGA